MTSAPSLRMDKAQGASRSARAASAARATAAGLLLPTGLILSWHFAVAWNWLPSTLIAPPEAVAADLAKLALNGTLLDHAKVSIGRLLLGFLIGSAAGVAVGSWVGLSRRAQRFLEPTLGVLAPIPPTAWIPLLIILLGFQEASKVWLIAIGVFFVLVTNAISGIRNVDARLVEVARVHDKTDVQILTTILLPGALPSILTGLRIALGLSWILLIAAEIIAADRGLGWFIYDARNYSRPDDMIAGMVSIGFLGMVSDRAMLELQARCLRWQNAFTGS